MNNKEISDQSIIDLIDYSARGYEVNFERNKEFPLLPSIIEILNSRYVRISKYLAPYSNQRDYTNNGVIEYFKIPYNKLLEVYNIALEQHKKAIEDIDNRALLEEQRIEELIYLAHIKGEKQKVNEYYVACEDPMKKCNLDLLIEYIDEEGKYSTKRIHLYK